MSQPPGSPAPLDRATEERILEAAHAVFMRRGTAGARMQDIADEAGVNKALLHYYFRSKDRLAHAVFRRAVGEILPRAFGIMAGDLPLAAKVRTLVDVELDFFLAHPYLPGYVLAEVNYHPEMIRQVFAERGAPPLGALEAQLRALSAAGDIRPITPDQFVVNLVSLVLFPFAARPLLEVLLGMDEPRFRAFIGQRKRELADFFLAGLRP